MTSFDRMNKTDHADDRGYQVCFLDEEREREREREQQEMAGS